jgi:PadR family transcriptional regulator PadR
MVLNSDVIRGHLDAIVLRLIYEKDCYGFELFKEIRTRTNDQFQIKEATLYAVFQRLEKKELIESYVGDVSYGGQRRYYRITKLGKAFLKEEIEEWKITKAIIDVFMDDING